MGLLLFAFEGIGLRCPGLQRSIGESFEEDLRPNVQPQEDLHHREVPFPLHHGRRNRLYVCCASGSRPEAAIQLPEGHSREVALEVPTTRVDAGPTLRHEPNVPVHPQTEDALLLGRHNGQTSGGDGKGGGCEGHHAEQRWFYFHLGSTLPRWRVRVRRLDAAEMYKCDLERVLARSKNRGRRL